MIQQYQMTISKNDLYDAKRLRKELKFRNREKEAQLFSQGNDITKVGGPNQQTNPLEYVDYQTQTRPGPQPGVIS